MSDICLPCKAGFHGECDLLFVGLLASDQDCCCEGLFEIDDLALLQEAADKLATRMLEGGAPHPGHVVNAYFEGFTGTKALEDYADPVSTGRKEAVDKFPKPVKAGCAWAYLKNCGGGPEPIIGCPGRSAETLHHGPDKNTMHNTEDNLQWICDECHNTWHARNDPYYGKRPTFPEGHPRAGKVDASKPFLPIGWEDHPEWLTSQPVPATEDEVFAEERRRRAA